MPFRINENFQNHLALSSVALEKICFGSSLHLLSSHIHLWFSFLLRFYLFTLFFFIWIYKLNKLDIYWMKEWDLKIALHFILFLCFPITGLRIEQKAKIRIEPGLFEWTEWGTSTTAPSFMTEKELSELGYSIDPTYK